LQITQLIKGIFLKRYDPTIEDSYKKEIVVDGTTCTLEVLDTAGTIREIFRKSIYFICYLNSRISEFTKNQLLQEQFTAMRDLYMKNGDGFIVVYSITDASSLINTVEIFQSLLRVRQKYHIENQGKCPVIYKFQFPLILVGNKCDDIINREVSRSVGERYAARYNSTFCEASAKNNIHVIEVFLLE
uniref:Ras family protein n=1 Tax=Onchocerca flexuosa TaxID=387005 RepID=A0A183I134_9BILA